MKNFPHLRNFIQKLENKDLEIEKSRRSLSEFTLYTKKNYEIKWFHSLMCDYYDAFMRKEIKNLMIFMPPQHGKSELNTRRLPCKLLGDSPSTRIAICAYNQRFVTQFNRDIQRIIGSKFYRELYPEIHLKESGGGVESSKYLRNNEILELVGHDGFVLTTSFSGSLTGRSIDIGIIDDPYKDGHEAWSESYREVLWHWYLSVFLSRLHNDSQQLITLTRWHVDDLASQILSEFGGDFEVLELPAIKRNNSKAYDKRSIGEALWPERHSLKKLEAISKKNSWIFEALYQQNPVVNSGLLFEKDTLKYFTMDELPGHPVARNGAIDPADQGTDYLCCIFSYYFESLTYIVDVIFTQDSIEISQPLVAERIHHYRLDNLVIESNGMGRIYAIQLKKLLINKVKTNISFRHNSQNKLTRILMLSGEIKSRFVFRRDYKQGSDYDIFMQQIYRFDKTGRNKWDDSVDALALLAEYESHRQENIKVY